MNNSCIIGHTGFVGSNLKNSMIFDDFYNSKNILEIKNKKYDLCVIAAPSAVKWKANKEPIQDLKSITSLLEILHDSHFKKVVLISTIDVYGDQVNLGLNEKDIPKWEVHPYGRNRKILETFLSDRFDCSVIRLPGLFGPGLKKNIIFDLMNDNMIHSISLDTEFQWLNLETLPEIIEFCLRNKIHLYNSAPEPISTREIVTTFFKDKTELCKGVYSSKYNVKSIHSSTGFTISRKEILKDLSRFIRG